MIVRAEDPELTVTYWPGLDAEGIYSTYKETWGDRPTYPFVTPDDESFQKAISGFGADESHRCARTLPKYREANLIEPWDVPRTPELKNTIPGFFASPVNQHEAGVWIVPADRGATVIAYVSELVLPEDMATLQVFADPEYVGKITMPNTSDYVWAPACLATGLNDWTNVTDEQFDVAVDWLCKVHPGLSAYVSSSTEIAEPRKTGEIMIARSWPDGFRSSRMRAFPSAISVP
jgi:spermidine/putrescine transport system substrate-binding protein